jgi:hypothetical protein
MGEGWTRMRIRGEAGAREGGSVGVGVWDVGAGVEAGDMKGGREEAMDQEGLIG